MQVCLATGNTSLPSCGYAWLLTCMSTPDAAAKGTRPLPHLNQAGITGSCMTMNHCEAEDEIRHNSLILRFERRFVVYSPNRILMCSTV
ncbi:hypothetical protein F4680DRAFT_422271 [Xylaria scruposa]|nr:hypothetical protein F4680DRAFT_422271 [Xylaria scruposa]